MDDPRQTVEGEEEVQGGEEDDDEDDEDGEEDEGEEVQAAGGDGEYVPSMEEVQGDEAAPRPKRRFRKSHCTALKPAPATEEQKRLIRPIGDR